jgi:hypothetical protein
MWWRPTYKHDCTEILGDSTTAKKIVELEREHNCRIVITGIYITLALNDTIIRPLSLTEADYRRYRPKEDESLGAEPTEDDSTGSISADDDSANNDSADDDSSEDQLAEG